MDNPGWQDAWIAGPEIAPFLVSMDPNSQICTSDFSVAEALREDRAAIYPASQRLLEAFSLLENIGLDRTWRRDPLFRKLVEERIIWRELIELELQEIDEQMERTSAAAAGDSPQL